jgi:hypothetical protein
MPILTPTVKEPTHRPPLVANQPPCCTLGSAGSATSGQHMCWQLYSLLQPAATINTCMPERTTHVVPEPRACVLRCSEHKTQLVAVVDRSLQSPPRCRRRAFSTGIPTRLMTNCANRTCNCQRQTERKRGVQTRLGFMYTEQYFHRVEA